MERVGYWKSQSLSLYGVTNRKQAQELAQYFLNINTKSLLWVEFRVGIGSVELEPGDVIGISHELLGDETKYFRIIEIEEESNNEARVVAREYTDAVFDFTKLQVPTVPAIKYIGLIDDEDEPLNVHLVAEAVTEGRPAIRLRVEPPHRRIREVEIWMRDFPMGMWRRVGLTYNEITIHDLDWAKRYEVKAVAVSRVGKKSRFVESPTQIVETKGVPISKPPRVRGSEVFGQRNVRCSMSKDFEITWLKTSNRAGFGIYPAGEEVVGAGETTEDPFFKDYEIRVFSAEGEHLRTESTKENKFVYTEQMNILDHGKFAPNVRFEVRQRNQQNELSEQAEIFEVAYETPLVKFGEFSKVYEFEPQFGRSLIPMRV